MEYPEEIYVGLAKPYGRSSRIPDALAERSYRLGYEAGKAEQSDYIQSMSSLESVLTDVEQLEGEDLPFVKRLIERTVRAVRAEQADPLAGYSNLTAAIKAGQPIDWEKLVRRKVQYVKPGFGALNWKMLRDDKFPADSASGWVTYGMSVACITTNAWHGKDGWALWIEGDVPIRRKTADQLKPGTEFYGVLKNSEPEGVAPELMLRTQRHALHLDDYTISQMSPRHFEVVKVVGKYGTFQKPEGK